MTYQSRVLLLFCLLLSIEHFSFAAAVHRLVISPVASDSEGLAVDSQGSVIHMLRSSTLNQFTITKTDADGDLV